MSKVLFVIAPLNFRDEELKIPKEIIEKKHEIEIASNVKDKEAIGMFGMRAKVDINLEEAIKKIDEYSAVIFVGGAGAQVYFDDEKAHSIARMAYNKGRIVAAICIAPSILAKAGILKGKKATVWDGKFIKIIETNGAIYLNKSVVVDGRIVTANGPAAAKEFGETILKML